MFGEGEVSMPVYHATKLTVTEKNGIKAIKADGIKRVANNYSQSIIIYLSPDVMPEEPTEELL